ncbi:MAG: hypothetical protein ACFFAO_08210 [Candidatus Hermodarchaeota archaeon]
MKNINNVLFLCSANICRSVAAEFIAKYFKRTQYVAELMNVNFDSAGLYLYNNFAYEGTIKYLKNKNIELNGFKPKRIEIELARLQDLILCFEEKRHVRKLLRRFKNLKDIEKKTFLLLDFAGETINKEIEDPLGFPPEEYKKTMERIESAVLESIKKIIKLNHK